MAWGFIMETPLSAEQYDHVNSQVGPNPEGLIVHIAAKGANGMRIIDVWESKEDFERFEREQIMPASEAMGLDAPSEPPPRDEFEVHNIRSGS